MLLARPRENPFSTASVQSRRFANVTSTSGLPPLATEERTSQIGSDGPLPVLGFLKLSAVQTWMPAQGLGMTDCLANGLQLTTASSAPNTSLRNRAVEAIDWMLARSSALFLGTEKPCPAPL